MSILQMNIYASLLIIFTVIIRAVGINKLPKKTFMILWLIIISRLLIPYTMPQVINVYPVINKVSNDILIAQPRQQPQEYFIPPEISQINTQTEIPVNPPTVMPEKNHININIPIYQIIWFAGIFTFGAWFIVPHIKYSRKYKTALPVESDSVASWVKSHRLRRKYKVMFSDEIAAPFTYGLFRPVILLSANIDFDNRELTDYILTHEYVHIKRFDIILKWLSAMTLCVNWFNPFVWVMYILMNRDIELSCDERVIKLKGETNKKSYALTLLDMESNKRSLNPLVNHFNKNSLKERVTAIMKSKKITIISIILAVVLIVSSTAILISSCTEKIEEPEDVTEEVKAIAPETTEYVDPYANVGFGETDDILLLDVEWHTYDTYLQQKELLAKKGIQLNEQYADYINDEKVYISKTINGKPVEGNHVIQVGRGDRKIDISKYLDENGYYIFNIYPYFPIVYYCDDNGAWQRKTFGTDENNFFVRSIYEYDYILKNEIIPFCDDLLAKGLITQEYYDYYTIANPLDIIC